MNPCPCGNALSLNRICRCNEMEIKRYKNKISEPLLDRMDLYVLMEEENDNLVSFTSVDLHKKVINAFVKQKQRKQRNLNGKLSDEELEIYCSLEQSLEDILNKATINFNLSKRSINKVKKVARTIADLENLENIDKKSLLKALSYRYR